MPEAQIFKATYSGVPVFEMMCKGVAVMRRRADGWLNATQILKVAGFDKPQRTRVLERDVQKGVHEKVQGGYGKYQGTWIPLERALALAKQFGCEALLRPIIEFQPDQKSPPLAPKHLVAPIPGRPPARRPAPADGAMTPSSVRTTTTRRVGREEIPSEGEEVSMLGSEDGSGTPSPSEGSSTSPTPPPLHEVRSGYASSNNEDEQHPRGSQRSMAGAAYGRQAPNMDVDSDGEDVANGTSEAINYCDEILEYFISDSQQVPQFLVEPPPDFDPNMAIDDDGHTALHWASAMGRIRVVKLLLTAGADIFKVNKSGQTALMRSVMFANNYDVRKFPELYELLHRSTLNIDHYNRTVFHHIVDVAMTKGKTHAARYYMETILNRLAEYPKELADIINFQDEDGETALTMAARCRSKRLVKLLIDHGADPKIMNRDGKSTEDYILEDERFRSSPVLPSRTLTMSYRNAQASQGHIEKSPLHHSTTAQAASTRCINEMASMLESLAASFDQELKEKERDMGQAHSLLGSIQTEILESQRSVAQLKQQSQGLEDAKERLHALEEQLKLKMMRRYRLGWEKWYRDEEERERAARASPLGAELPTIPFGPPAEPSDGLMTVDGAQIDHDASNGASHSKADVPMDSLKPRTSPAPRNTSAPSPQLAASSYWNGGSEDISDLRTLYSDLPDPSDSNAIAAACAAIRSELEAGRTQRRGTFDTLVRLEAEAGTGGRMGQYRRLIGAGCGGLAPAEVDDVIGTLLETLEAEEPSTAALTWSSTPAKTSVTATS